MDFARGRLGGGIPLSVQTVDDLGAHLRAVVDELRDANLSRTVFFQTELPSPVICDVSRVQQLLSNLLGNALSHGADDLPIKVQASNDAGDVVISVTNYGNPIPENLLHEVFEPYWRPATSAPGGGLGLGLFICKQIVEAHAGTLEVRSSLEQGTCFTARIPSIPTRPN